jgi:hypothetical protein
MIESAPVGENWLELAACQAAVSAHQPTTAADGRIGRRISDGPEVSVLLGAKAEQGGNISNFIEFGIVVVDVKEFDAMADDPGQDGFADVDKFASFAAANGAKGYEVGIKVTASSALDGLGAIFVSYEKGLHFSRFKGAEHAAQSSDAAAVAAGLRNGFIHGLAAALLLRFGKDALRLIADFVRTGVCDVRVKAAQQLLQDVGMQLVFDMRPVRFGAAENPLFEHTFIQSVFQEIGGELEVLAGLIFDAALCVAAIVSRKPVAAAAAGKRMKETFALGQLAKAKIEKAGAMAIDQNNSQIRKCPEQLCDGLQMKMAIDYELRLAQLGG